jgi:hypothetical protein
VGIGKVDTILAVSPPIQVGMTAHLLANIKRASSILLVQDSLGAVQLGMMSTRT